ncbi:MAG: hypothetical protein VKK05_03035 [Synechococcus sp.]|jgi:hypothetical protein|nr:hypothetical protein [Synechococcus sp.]
MAGESGGADQRSVDKGSSDNPMLVLISGILLLGGIATFISWGLTHAYPSP